MKFNRKQQYLIFLGVNALVVLGALFFPIYAKFLSVFNRCTLLEVFHIYCPLCGGTRAMNAFLHFDIIASVRYNPIVLICAVLFVAYEVAMLYHLIRGTKERPFLIPTWVLWMLGVVCAVIFIVRNGLLLFGIDDLGNVLG